MRSSTLAIPLFESILPTVLRTGSHMLDLQSRSSIGQETALSPQCQKVMLVHWLGGSAPRPRPAEAAIENDQVWLLSGPRSCYIQVLVMKQSTSKASGITYNAPNMTREGVAVVAKPKFTALRIVRA